ncbi:MAG: glycoside hydrolase family 18 protein [Pseudomonadota bacterium]
MTKYSFFLAATFAVCGCSNGDPSNGSTPSSDFWVTGYYPEYSYHLLPPSEIDFSALTHLISTAVEPTTSPPYADFSRLTKEEEIIGLAHAAGVKVLIGIDGTGYSGGDNNLATIMANDTSAKAFAYTLLSHARTAGYDGIDIDWEADVTAEAFTKLVELLENGTGGDPGLKSWTETTPHGLIVVSISASDYFLDDWNYAVTNEYVDQWNFMAYTFDYVANGWAGQCTDKPQNIIGFNAPLYRPDSTYPALAEWSASYDGGPGYLSKTAKYWGANGADIKKLGMGVPFYGDIWPGNDVPGQTDCGKSIWQAPIMYRDILSYIENGGTYHFDDASKTPWIGGTAVSATAKVSAEQKFYITFDDARSMAEKTQWAKANGIGGIMIWSLVEGYLPTAPAGQRHPLLQAIKNAL